eukprot:m.57269 g.57269  ORF g.57269 m.57269 type:complete len:94 (+) comp11221_c1_seq2:667-948(+)
MSTAHQSRWREKKLKQESTPALPQWPAITAPFFFVSRHNQRDKLQFLKIMFFLLCTTQTLSRLHSSFTETFVYNHFIINDKIDFRSMFLFDGT